MRNHWFFSLFELFVYLSHQLRFVAIDCKMIAIAFIISFLFLFSFFGDEITGKLASRNRLNAILNTFVCNTYLIHFEKSMELFTSPEIVIENPALFIVEFQFDYNRFFCNGKSITLSAFYHYLWPDDWYSKEFVDYILSQYDWWFILRLSCYIQWPSIILCWKKLQIVIGLQWERKRRWHNCVSCLHIVFCLQLFRIAASQYLLFWYQKSHFCRLDLRRLPAESNEWAEKFGRRK